MERAVLASRAHSMTRMFLHGGIKDFRHVRMGTCRCPCAAGERLMAWGMEPDQRAANVDAERGIPSAIRPFIPAFLVVLLGIGTLMLRVAGAINDTASSIVSAILIAAGLLFYVLINRGIDPK